MVQSRLFEFRLIVNAVAVRDSVRSQNGELMRTHPEVLRTVDRHLQVADEFAPGLLEGLYVIGSSATQEYVSGISDVDFVAVLARSPDQRDLDALSRAHSAVGGPPLYEGVYITRHDLPDPPHDHDAVPHAYAGRFRPPEACCLLTPMTWVDLVQRGDTVRGERADRLGIVVDPATVRSYLLKNVRTYWAPLVQQAQLSLVGDDNKLVNGAMISWVLLSVARAHFTFGEIRLITKAQAGGHAAGLFPSHSGLVERAVRWRADHALRFTQQDARVALDLCLEMIDDVTAQSSQSAMA
jgi:hypothetical protein